MLARILGQEWHGAAKAYKKRAPRHREALLIRDCSKLLVRRAVAASAAAATRAIRGDALHVGQQRRLRARERGEGAEFAASSRPNRNPGGRTAGPAEPDRQKGVKAEWVKRG